MNYADALKVLNKEITVPRKVKDKLARWRDVYYDISLHTTGTCPWFMDLDGRRKLYPTEYLCEEYQWRFNNRLMNRHPNEPEASRWYRYSIYRPLTKAPFNRAIQVISGAIFQDSNYSITVRNDKDNAYIFGNNFSGTDLMGYFANVGFKNMVEDPNGFFVRMPDKPYYEQQSEQITVEVRFVNTKDVIWYEKDFIIFRCHEYAFYIDKETVWRFTEVNGKWILTPEDSEGYYAHMFGYLPVTVAGGEWNTHGHYDSYLDAPKALCDEFISTFSAAQVVDKEASHPYIQAVRPDCPECDGTGKYNVCKDCSKSEHDCACGSTNYMRFAPRPCLSCGGHGYTSRNPMQWINVPVEDADKNIDYLKYISPQIDINKHHREVVKMLTEEILKALHLYRTDKAESGEAKAIDQAWLYQFLSKVANHLFDKVIFDTIRDIIGYRNIRVDNGSISPDSGEFTIIKPNQFNIKTTEDLLNDYEKGKTAGLPDILRQRQARDFADKAYSGDAILLKKVHVSIAIDPLFVKSIDEIMSARIAGAVTVEQVVLHENLTVWLDKAIEERGDKWFLSAKIEDIEAVVRGNMPPPNTLLNGLPQGT